MDQHEFVRGAYAYYAENGYEPGNPEDGVWHDCHYPVPAWKGGTETIKLLIEHHAVHGVLQSEEFQHPCVYGWEKQYLQGEYLNLFSKWMSAKARPAQEASKAYWMSVPDEEFRSIQSVKGKKAWESLSQLERSNELTRRANLLSEEERIEKAKKGWETKKLKGNAYAPPGMSIPVRVTAPSGEVMTFSSMTAAALELNCSRVSVYRHATGKRVVSKLKGYLIELETT